MGTYTTTSGQTWDQIAYEAYANEMYCGHLMDANRDKLDYFVFPDGVALNLPDKNGLDSIASVPSDFPAWRAMLNG